MKTMTVNEDLFHNERVPVSRGRSEPSGSGRTRGCGCPSRGAVSHGARVTAIRRPGGRSRHVCLTMPWSALAAVMIAIQSANPVAAQDALPDEWVDKDTGHKVIRLSRREGENRCLYFHQNMFTADGDKMVFVGTTPQGRRAFTVNLKTHAIRQVTTEPGGGFEILAPKRRELFYINGRNVMATHVDTLETRKIARVPRHYARGRGFSVNADETMLTGCYALGEGVFYAKYRRPEWIRKIFEARLPNAIYGIDIKTGRIDEFHRENEWIGPVQFSPTAPSLVMFCHEGPERRLDRIWLVRTDGTGLCTFRGQTVPEEFITHEFWQPDGQGVWYDLQIPRYAGSCSVLRFFAWANGPRYYLARKHLATNKEERYRVPKHQYSWHYNVSPDGTMLCGDGDGRDPFQGSANKWIYLFTPRGNRIEVERLCRMAKHDYNEAPHARFTPDGKWVVFQSNAGGHMQVYAVEVRRSHS